MAYRPPTFTDRTARAKRPVERTPRDDAFRLVWIATAIVVGGLMFRLGSWFLEPESVGGSGSIDTMRIVVFEAWLAAAGVAFGLCLPRRSRWVLVLASIGVTVFALYLVSWNILAIGYEDACADGTAPASVDCPVDTHPIAGMFLMFAALVAASATLATMFATLGLRMLWGRRRRRRTATDAA